MYSLHTYKSYNEIIDIHTLWDKMYIGNDELSPFQAYIWNKCLIENKVYIGKLHFIALYKYDKLLIIAPLIKRNRILYKELSFLGYNTHSDYLNFIYNKDLEYEDFNYFINEILNSERSTVWRLNLISEGNLISKFIDNLGNIKEKDKGICVGIPIYNTEDEYNDTIKKRTREKIKSKKNVLEKEFNSIEFSILRKTHLSEEQIRELLELCSKRREEKNNKLKTQDMKLLKQYIRENRENFLATCYLDGKLAAYNLGFLTPSNSICVLILVIDSCYKKYNIGNILLYNTVCSIIKENSKISEDYIKCKYYDLTRGNEAYKYAYGGIEHYVNHFVITNKKYLLKINSIILRISIVIENPLIILSKIRR